MTWAQVFTSNSGFRSHTRSEPFTGSIDVNVFAICRLADVLNSAAMRASVKRVQAAFLQASEKPISRGSSYRTNFLPTLVLVSSDSTACAPVLWSRLSILRKVLSSLLMLEMRMESLCCMHACAGCAHRQHTRRDRTTRTSSRREAPVLSPLFASPAIRSIDSLLPSSAIFSDSRVRGRSKR